VSEPEYVVFRKYESGVSNVLSRIRFPESQSTIEIAEKELSFKNDSSVLEVGCGSGVTNMHLIYKVGLD